MIVREEARYWWVFLLTGIAWLVIAWLVLRLNVTSLTTVGVLLGVVFIAAGLTGLCLVVAAACGQRRPRWARVVAVLLLLVAVADLARATRAIQGHYQEAWRQMAALRREVDAAGSRAAPDAPLGASNNLAAARHQFVAGR